VLQRGTALKKSELQIAVPQYKLGKQLGAGGNAIVYKAKTGSGTVAIKFLVNPDPKRFARFRDEVLVVTTTLKDSPRVIPILEHHLPDPQEAASAWYVMPVATTLRNHLSAANQLKIIDAIAQVSEALAELHAAKVAHRDIKPENLFFHDKAYRFGDFGIAKFPESAGLTTATEPMGPAGYMADEMIRDSMSANPFRADIFSLAKTLWALFARPAIA
jgi:serine/threonine protein kinase